MTAVLEPPAPTPTGRPRPVPARPAAPARPAPRPATPARPARAATRPAAPVRPAETVASTSTPRTFAATTVAQARSIPTRSVATKPATPKAVEATNTLPKFRSVHRPDIEGLRAIAVLSVLAFHATVPGLAGGFVGVDVFFVISGFLITGLLLAEARDTGRVSLREFYARRARRILPGAALVLGVTAAASFLILPPLRVRDVAQDLALSALYASNWRFIGLDTDYLTENRAPSPVLHYWSLAVEEQFYVVWPLLILGVFLLARGRRRALITLLAGVLGLATVASLAVSLHWTSTSAPLAYLSSPSRAWQFGAGAMLAALGPCLAGMRERATGRALGLVLGWAGLAGVLAACVAFDSTTAYPGVAALLPTLATVALIAGGSLGGWGTGTVGGLLQTAPMRAMGRLSYAWYLWHWPVLVLVQAELGPQPWTIQLLLVLGAALPAMLTMWLVERPIRFNRTIATRSSSGIAIGVVATVVSLAAALTAGTMATRQLLNVSGPPTTVSLDALFGADGGRNSGAVTPTPLAARTDMPMNGECISQVGSDVLLVCPVGATTGPLLVMFGDSHAQQWQDAIDAVGKRRGFRVDIISHAACPPADIPRRAGDPGLAACARWRSAALAKIAQLHPDVVVVTAFQAYNDRDVDLFPAWRTVLDTLKHDAKTVAYLRDNPHFDQDTSECVSANLDDWSACAADRADALWADPVQSAIALQQYPKLPIIDLSSYLCPASTCPAVRNGYLLYRDQNHLTNTVAKVLGPAFEGELDRNHLIPAKGSASAKAAPAKTAPAKAKPVATGRAKTKAAAKAARRAAKAAARRER